MSPEYNDSFFSRRRPIYPYPEAFEGPLGLGWSIIGCWPGMGFADLVKKILVVPLSPDIYSRNIRAHECAHAFWSRGLPADLAALYGVHVNTLQKTEDAKNQCLLTRAGIDLSAGFLEVDTVKAALGVLLKAGDYKEAALSLVAAGFSGTEGVIRDVLKAAARQGVFDADECLRLGRTVFLELACDPSQQTVGRMAHFLDNEFRLLDWNDPPETPQGTSDDNPRSQQPKSSNSEESGSGQSKKNNKKQTPDTQQNHRELWSTLRAEAAKDRGYKKRSSSPPRAKPPAALSDIPNILDVAKAELEELALQDPELIDVLADHGSMYKPRFPLSLKDHVPWGKLEVETPPLPTYVAHALLRRYRASQYGSAICYAHRLFIDDKVFRKVEHIHGGIICLDASMSMQWKPGDIFEMVKTAPGVIVGAYAGLGDRGVLKVLAANGRMAARDDCTIGLSGNVVDLPALNWAVSQFKKGFRGPIVWISDGLVTASNETVGRRNLQEIKDFLRVHGIKRVETMQEALKLLRAQRR